MIGLAITGFSDSVYTRAVRLALIEKGLAHEYHEPNPFTDEGRAALMGIHPFGRVPVLQHYAFRLYETTAILGYLDDAFDGPELFPQGAKARARVLQVISIVDAYGYWPLVRQVFSHALYRPAMGEGRDEAQITAGLAASVPVLDALEEIAEGGLVLNGRDITRADCMLAPMIDCFCAVPDGQTLLGRRPALTHWFDAVCGRESFAQTRPAVLTRKENTP